MVVLGQKKFRLSDDKLSPKYISAHSALELSEMAGAHAKVVSTLTSVLVDFERSSLCEDCYPSCACTSVRLGA